MESFFREALPLPNKFTFLMQKALFILLLFTLYTGVVKAQTVVVPDPIFKSCLLNTYPQSFESNGELNIQTAEIQTIELNCNTKGIKSVEGMQYFKNVKKIDISHNLIMKLPDLSGLNNLEELYVHDNQLDTLPGVEYMSNLRFLEIGDNNIRNISKLEFLSNLEVLKADNNPLLDLPYMDRFSNLQVLSISGCGLTELADLSKLANLKYLRCDNNELVILPDLSALGNLELLNAANNALEEFPILPFHDRLAEIFLYQNNIRSLSNLQWNDSISVLNLDYNYLSFEDFLPLTNLSAFPDKLIISEQKVFSEFQDQRLLEKQTFHLELSVIGKADGQIISWYRNDTLLTSGADTFFNIGSVAKDHTGGFLAKVTHPQFPEITLITEPAYLTVENCLETDVLSFAKYDLNCENKGAIVVSANSQPQPIENYILTNTVNQTNIYSGDGHFDKLEEGVFELRIQTGQCTKVYPEFISVEESPCRSIFITPNGDGIDDDYYLSESGNAAIRDKSGYLIKEINLPGAWDGTGQSGKVSPGLYFIDINNGEHIIQISVVY